MATELYRRFHAMKTYGKEPESLESIIEVFASDLSAFPAEQILLAIKTHSQRSQEFPTVADIVGLIKRKGKPPLSEAQFIAINKKAGEDRTPEEWQYLRDYQAERDGGWADAPDQAKTNATLAENIRLRKELMDLKEEYQRLAGLLRAARAAAEAVTTPAAEPTEAKARRTIEEMRKAGAAEEDIRQFAAMYNIDLAAA